MRTSLCGRGQACVPRTGGRRIRLLIRDFGHRYGAFMEPSGRNQWQPVANRKTRKRRNQAKTVATGCDQLPWDLDGKEGVDGSSPSEGLHEVPANGTFVLPESRTRGHIPDTSAVRATHRDVSRRLPTQLAGETRSRRSTKPLQRGHRRCLSGRESDSLSMSEVFRSCVGSPACPKPEVRRSSRELDVEQALAAHARGRGTRSPTR
jgi:hypothetical protein